MTLRIFICYGNDDFRGRGRKLYNYLSKHIEDSNVYIDQSKPKGIKWREENDANLRESDIVVVILTPAALVSTEVEREVKIARELRKIIIPCKDDNLDKKWSEIPWNLGDLDGIEFEDDEILETRLYRGINKVKREIIDKSKKVIAVDEKISLQEPMEKITRKLEHSADTLLIKEGSLPVIVNKQVRELGFKIHEGSIKILSAVADNDALSIIFEVDCKEDGRLEIALPRSLIDSKIGNEDDIFFVLLDGVESYYEEKITSSDRTLDIHLPKGTRNIEVVGTQLLGFSYAGLTRLENVVKILGGSSSPHGGKYLDLDVITVKVGDKVKWENDDTAAHTITSGTTENGPDGLFDSSLIGPGKTFEVTFNERDSFDYHCMVHPWKKGRIVVV